MASLTNNFTANLSEAREPLANAVPHLTERLMQLINRVSMIHYTLDGTSLLKSVEEKEAEVIGISNHLSAAHAAITTLESWVNGIEDVVGR